MFQVNKYVKHRKELLGISKIIASALSFLFKSWIPLIFLIHVLNVRCYVANNKEELVTDI